MDALSEARARLSSRISDKRLLMVPGLSDDLRAILAAFEELEQRATDLECRAANLAAFSLRKHYWPMSPALNEQLCALIDMAKGALGPTHSERCLCSECMGVG